MVNHNHSSEHAAAANQVRKSTGTGRSGRLAQMLNLGSAGVKKSHSGRSGRLAQMLNLRSAGVKKSHSAYTPIHPKPSTSPLAQLQHVVKSTPGQEAIEDKYDFVASDCGGEQPRDLSASDPVPKRKQGGAGGKLGLPTVSADRACSHLAGVKPFSTFGRLLQPIHTRWSSMSPSTSQKPQPNKQATIKDSLQSHKEKEALPSCAPPGMENHGNMCYMNAVLQVLFSLAPFTDELLTLHAPDADKDGGGGGLPCPTHPLAASSPTRESSGIGGRSPIDGANSEGQGGAHSGKAAEECSEGPGDAFLEYSPQLLQSDEQPPPRSHLCQQQQQQQQPRLQPYQQHQLQGQEGGKPATAQACCTRRLAQKKAQAGQQQSGQGAQQGDQQRGRPEQGSEPWQGDGQQQSGQGAQQGDQQRGRPEQGSAPQQGDEQQQGCLVVEDAHIVGRHLPPRGVARAMLGSLREYMEVAAYKSNVSGINQGNPRRPYISPLPIKRAMCGEQWAGDGQQDTHEYFVALLDQMQHEVLGAQVIAARGAENLQEHQQQQQQQQQPEQQQQQGHGSRHGCGMSCHEHSNGCKGSKQGQPQLANHPHDQADVTAEGGRVEAEGSQGGRGGNQGAKGRRKGAKRKGEDDLEAGGDGCKSDSDQQGKKGGEQVGGEKVVELKEEEELGDGARGAREKGTDRVGVKIEGREENGRKGAEKRERQEKGETGMVQAEEKEEGGEGGKEEGGEDHEKGKQAAPPLAALTTRINLSSALCPGVRTFSGCLRNTYVCRACHHETLLKEPFTHLSLQLPSGWGLNFGLGSKDLEHLLKAHFEKEDVEKTCDKCGAKAAKHLVTHEVLRLPRVLALHLKRFSLEPPLEEGGLYRCLKLHTSISLSHPKSISLGPYCVQGVRAHPLLANHAARMRASSKGKGEKVSPGLLSGTRRCGGGASSSESDKENHPEGPARPGLRMQPPSTSKPIALAAHPAQQGGRSPLVVGSMGAIMGSIGSSSGIGLQHTSNDGTSTTPSSGSKDQRHSTLVPAALGLWQSPQQRSASDFSPGFRGGGQQQQQQQQQQKNKQCQEQQQRLHRHQQHEQRAPTKPQGPRLDKDLQRLLVRPDYEDDDSEGNTEVLPTTSKYEPGSQGGGDEVNDDAQLQAAIEASMREHVAQQQLRQVEAGTCQQGLHRPSNGGLGPGSGGLGSSGIDQMGVGSSGSGSHNIHSNGSNGASRDGRQPCRLGGGAKWSDGAGWSNGATAGSQGGGSWSVGLGPDGESDVGVQGGVVEEDEEDADLKRALVLSLQEEQQHRALQALCNTRGKGHQQHHGQHHEEEQQQQQPQQQLRQDMPPPSSTPQRQRLRRASDLDDSANRPGSSGSKKARRGEGEQGFHGSGGQTQGTNTPGGTSVASWSSQSVGGWIGVVDGVNLDHRVGSLGVPCVQDKVGGGSVDMDVDEGLGGGGDEHEAAIGNHDARAADSTICGGVTGGCKQGGATHTGRSALGAQAGPLPPHSPVTPAPTLKAPRAPLPDLHASAPLPQSKSAPPRTDTQQPVPGHRQRCIPLSLQHANQPPQTQQQHQTEAGQEGQAEQQAPGVVRSRKAKGPKRQFDPQAPVLNLLDDDATVPQEDEDEQLQKALAESLKPEWDNTRHAQHKANIWEDIDNFPLAVEEGGTIDGDDAGGGQAGKAAGQTKKVLQQQGSGETNKTGGGVQEGIGECTPMGNGRQVCEVGGLLETGEEGGAAFVGTGEDQQTREQDRAGRGDDPSLPNVMVLEEEVTGESSSSGSWDRDDGEEDGYCWGDGSNGCGPGARRDQHQRQPQQGKGGAKVKMEGDSSIPPHGGSASKGMQQDQGVISGFPTVKLPAAAAHPPHRRLPLLHELAHYRLHGAVCHRGPTLLSGHYVADVALPCQQQPRPQQQQPGQQQGTVDPELGAGKGEGKQEEQQQWQWWRFDDTYVSPLEPEVALKEQGADGYLLFLVCDPTAAAAEVD